MKINIIEDNDVPINDVHIICNKQDKPKLLLFYILCNSMSIDRIDSKNVELINKLIKELL